MSYRYDSDCPKCDKEVQLELFRDDKCPYCGHPGYWDEDCLEDYSDCFNYFVWEKVDNGDVSNI